MKIKLNYNYGYKWLSQNGIYVKGYVFDKKNKLYDGKELINYFQNITSEDQFLNCIKNANGLFTVIINSNNKCFIATDKTRTFPIFYVIQNNKIHISDDTNYLKLKFDNQYKEESINEYLAMGYVTSKDTLLKGIYQVQAGEYLVFDGTLKSNFYYDYITKFTHSKNTMELKTELINILDKVILRLIKVADGNQIVVPLSGGYDSRLIVALLKKHNYKNVFCFTYGNKNSFEVNISEKVAKQLKYEWFFVEYNDKTIPNNYSDTISFKHYYQYTANNSSFILLQDYFAVKYLHDNKIISKNAIFVPGHSGDFLGGSQLMKFSKKISKKNIIENIITNYYTLNNFEYKKKLFFLKEQLNYKVASYSIIENFVMKEKLSKHIVNANKVYEFYGYHHLLPYWDTQLVDFFKNLPYKYKINTNFYNRVLIEEIFIPFDIDFRKTDISKINPLKSNLKHLIKILLPKYIVNKIKSNLKYEDFNNFYLFKNSLQKNLKKQFKAKNINSLISYWYINQFNKYNT